DPLDWWARYSKDKNIACDSQTALDLAHDYTRAGFFVEAIELLKSAGAAERDLPDQSWGAQPLVHYTVGWLHEKVGDSTTALKHFKRAALLPPDYCFPARLEEIATLGAAMRASPRDAKAPFYLGNLLYDRRHHAGAIMLSEKSAKLDPSFSIVWRNLGIGYFNILK